MSHFEPLRPNRFSITEERYEFAHGKDSICVYDIHTLQFIKEIPVGNTPDCHATTCSNRYLYVACLDGLYIIDQNSLTVSRVLQTGPVYATNSLPDGKTMLVHDTHGGVLVIRDIEDMEKVHIYKRLDILHDEAAQRPRVEIGGKGNFLRGGAKYLVAGWHSSKIFTIDIENDYAWKLFMPEQPEFYAGDDLVITADKTKAYIACHRVTGLAYVAVIDIENKKLLKCITTGAGTCGLTMTKSERYVVASNDLDDSISVIDAQIDEVINTLSAREGFRQLGFEKGYIQGISAATDDSIFVYECSGMGAIVKFENITGEGRYTVSYEGGIAAGNCR